LIRVKCYALRVNRKMISVTGSVAVLVGIGVAGGIALASPAHKQPAQQIVRQVDQAVSPTFSASATREKAAVHPAVVPAVVSPSDVQSASEEPAVPDQNGPDVSQVPQQADVPEPGATVGADGNPLPKPAPPEPVLTMPGVVPSPEPVSSTPSS
jgi:hypothetical protein